MSTPYHRQSQKQQDAWAGGWAAESWDTTSLPEVLVGLFQN